MSLLGFIAQLRTCITCVCVCCWGGKSCAAEQRALSANTHRTKNPLTWKLKYKIYFQPECLLPIHIKWRSLVWVNNEFNLPFSSREHKAAPGLHPANPSSCQITEGQCKTQLHLRGGFFCHKVIQNYPASRNLSMQANKIGWGRVTQQDTGGGVEKGKLKREMEQPMSSF